MRTRIKILLGLAVLRLFVSVTALAQEATPNFQTCATYYRVGKAKPNIRQAFIGRQEHKISEGVQISEDLSILSDTGDAEGDYVRTFSDRLRDLGEDRSAEAIERLGASCEPPIIAAIDKGVVKQLEEIASSSIPAAFHCPPKQPCDRIADFSKCSIITSLGLSPLDCNAADDGADFPDFACGIRKKAQLLKAPITRRAVVNAPAMADAVKAGVASAIAVSEKRTENPVERVSAAPVSCCGEGMTTIFCQAKKCDCRADDSQDAVTSFSCDVVPTPN